MKEFEQSSGIVWVVKQMRFASKLDEDEGKKKQKMRNDFTVLDENKQTNGVFNGW